MPACPTVRSPTLSASRRRRVTGGFDACTISASSAAIYADIDPAAIGLSLQAMISVSLQANARAKIRNFIQQIRRKPQVMDVYFLAGADDFILHVAARDTDDLRSFVVENLNSDADVAGTQTSLIFEHLRGASPL